MIVLHARVAATVTGFLTTDRSFHKEDILSLRLAVLHLLVTQVVDDLVRFILHGRVGRVFLTYITQILAITDYLLVAYGNITGSLVSHMHIMMLVAQTAQGTAHGDHVIIRVRTEYDHFLRIRVSTLRTIGIVGVRFTTRPSGNRMLDIIEYLDIYIIRRTIQG